jgi:hypothetical protein
MLVFTALAGAGLGIGVIAEAVELATYKPSRKMRAHKLTPRLAQGLAVPLPLLQAELLPCGDIKCSQLSSHEAVPDFCSALVPVCGFKSLRVLSIQRFLGDVALSAPKHADVAVLLPLRDEVAFGKLRSSLGIVVQWPTTKLEIRGRDFAVVFARNFKAWEL